jgi:hypothetical protein
MSSTSTGQSTTDKIKDKLGMGKKDYSKQARADRKQARIARGEGSDTSSSSEDEQGNRYTEEERQRRKKDHAAKREARRAKNKITPNK